MGVLKDFCLFAVMVLSVSFPCICQGRQLPITSLGMKEGMSSDYVTHLVHDEYGFMWVATYYGLNRYDGDRFSAFLKEGRNSITSNNDISCLMSDTISEKVWIGHRRHGVNVYDLRTQSMHEYRHNGQSENSLSSDEVFGIVQSSAGDIYVVNRRGIDRYDRCAGGFVKLCDFSELNLPDDIINVALCGTQGQIYLGYASSGLAMLDPSFKIAERFTVDDGMLESSIPSNTVFSLYLDRNASLWIGTHGGLSIMDLRRRTFVNFRDIPGMYGLMKDNINAIHKSREGRYWIGTISDLCYFDADELPAILAGEDTVKHMFIRDFQYGISNPTVNAIAEDNFGNIWVGSRGGGVCFVDDKKKTFNSWRIDKIPGVVNGINDKEVMTVCKDLYGNIWMGTDGGGINVNRHGVNGEYHSYSNGRTTSTAYNCSVMDSNGDLWFGTVGWGIIDVYRDRTKTFDKVRLLEGEHMMECIFEDNRGTVWIGTPSGLEQFDLDTSERHKIHLRDFIGTDWVTAIGQDGRGNLWIGTKSCGLFASDGNAEHFGESLKACIEGCAVNQIYLDSKGRLWAAMDEGLCLIENINSRDVKVYTVADGLACDKICSLTEDYDGNIWMSTNVGISCYNDTERKFYNFCTDDGVLQGSYFPNSVTRADDGTIYFGGLHGVCYFNPKNLFESKKLPRIMFTEFKVHGSGLLSTDSIVPIVDGNVRLNADQNIFSVSFNIMDKSVHGHIEYAYKLAGLNDQWINIGTENKVTFRNVPYKKYTLYVRARYKQLDWSDEYSAIDIEVVPPFWRHPFMLCLYALVVVLATFYLLRSYNHRLKLRNSLELEKVNAQKLVELNEEKLKFYTNITHELRTPLTLILGPIEDLENSGDIGSEQRKKIALIHSNALRLLSLVTKILEFRKTETQNKRLRVSRSDIADCVRESGLKFETLAKNRNIDFCIKLPEERKEVYFDYESISIIVDNLLSNAFKYTEKGKITLSVKFVRENGVDYVDIVVADTGIGISKEDIGHIFDRYYRSDNDDNTPGFGIGLALVKNLVDLHEGILSVESEPNVGSAFKVRLIVDNTYPEATRIEEPMEKSAEPGNKSDIPSVLVVEDEEEMRRYISGELKKNYEVLTAPDGEEGVRLAEEKLPDLIVSDIMMPGLDGYELCRRLKANPATAHIPIMLLSAKDSNQDKIDGYDAGADSYLTKPFSSALLKSRVANILEDRKKIVAQIANNPKIKRSIITKSMTKIENEFMERFIDIINAHIEDEKIDMPTVAGQMSLSYSSLYRKVKNITNLSPVEFIRKLRLHKAEQMLLSGKYSISQICTMVGFSSQSYFRECFKAEFGMSPTDYLRSIKGDDV